MKSIRERLLEEADRFQQAYVRNQKSFGVGGAHLIRRKKLMLEAAKKIKELEADVSLLEYNLCEASEEGHVWEKREPNETFPAPWKQCKKCGGAMTKAKYELMDDED